MISTTRSSRAALVCGCLIAVLALAPFPVSDSWRSLSMAPAAEAQNFGYRTINGKVFNDRGAPVEEATIFLRNVKTKTVRSYSSIADGSYQFAQVGMVDDYEVWAEKDNHKSPVKAISSFDARKQLNIDLKLK